MEEFKGAVKTLENYGIKIDDPVTTFNEIDKNGGGSVLFEEFCDWVIFQSFMSGSNLTDEEKSKYLNNLANKKPLKSISRKS